MAHPTKPEFGKVWVPDGGRSTEWREATCKCGAKAHVKNNNGLPGEHLAEMFRRKGWRIANRGYLHTCPTCVKAETKPRALPIPPAEVVPIKSFAEAAQALAQPAEQEPPPVTTPVKSAPVPSRPLRAKNNLSLSEKIAVMDHIRPLLVKDEADGTWEYLNGQSDETVARAMRFSCTSPNVAHVRREMFGQLKQVIPANASLEIRIARLERLFTMLAADLGYEVHE